MKDKEKQIEEMAKHGCYDGCASGLRKFCDEYDGKPCKNMIRIASGLYEQGYRKLPEDSVVLSREEYEKLKKYECKVQCGVCFTQKEWFDFINEDSNRRTSLLIEAKEQGYEQAHKEMLKDCIESNKIAEQIGYKKGSKETAEKILNELYCTPKEQVESKIKKLARFIGVEIKE